MPYLARRGTPRTTADLDHHDIVGFTGTGDRMPQAPHVERLAKGRYACRSNSLLTLTAALRRRYGLRMTSCFLADPDPGMVRVLQGDVGYHFDRRLVVHLDLRQAPQHPAGVRRDRAAVRRGPGAFRGMLCRRGVNFTQGKISANRLSRQVESAPRYSTTYNQSDDFRIT